jgi:hypothetical protein
MKAKKATVTIGHIEIDGYLTEDGKFGLSTAGLGRLCGFERTQSTSKIMSNKRVKILAAKGFETYKNVRCENLTLSLIELDWVPAVLQCLALSGNSLAEELLLVFAGLSLQQLFCDAFGQKFETQERQAWLQIRTQGIEKRNKWTDAIKAYGESHPVTETWQKWIYCNVSDRLNTALTGHKAKHWCDLLECTPGTLRDNWTPSHLSNVEAIERHATVLCIRGMEPMDALEASVQFFDLPVNPQPQKVQSIEAKYKADRRAKGLAN